MKVQVIPWTLESHPTEKNLRERLKKENLSPYSWSNAPGDRYPSHSHTYGKVIYVVNGSITWILPESHEELETKRGDRLELPGEVVHAAEVGPQGVTCLEAHIPPT